MRWSKPDLCGFAKPFTTRSLRVVWALSCAGAYLRGRGEGILGIRVSATYFCTEYGAGPALRRCNWHCEAPRLEAAQKNQSSRPDGRGARLDLGRIWAIDMWYLLDIGMNND